MEVVKNILIKLFGKLFSIFMGFNVWLRGLAIFF